MKSVFTATLLAALISLGLAAVWEDFETMSWEPGDQVACRYHGFAGFMGMKHWMLVGNKDQVFYVGKNKTIVQQHYSMVPRNFRPDMCINDGQGSFGAQAVRRASMMLHRSVYTSFWACNSKDYVKFWADGSKAHYFCTFPEDLEILYDAELL